MSECSQLTFVGHFTVQQDSLTAISCLNVPLGKEILIGRDSERCQLVFENLQVSNHHVKIYSIVHDVEGKSGIGPLVYAEDLSSNGTYWNGSLMGKHNGGFLLRDGDQLGIYPKIILTYHSELSGDFDDWKFDKVQEEEMRYFRSSYEVSRTKLGAGIHGQVYMAVSQSVGRQLACKVVDLRKVRAEEKENVQSSYTFKNAQIKYGSTSSTLKAMAIVQKRVIERKVTELKIKQLREVEILKDMIHPNIIRLEKVYHTNNTLYIFEELISGGDLFSYLESKGGCLAEIEAAVIIRQLLKALTFLHARGIVHRDIKPDNVLMTSSLDTARVVLSDFGSAVQLTTAARSVTGCSILGVRRMESRVGTWDYLAPEVIGKNPYVTAKGYTEAVDLWSLGCVTAALLTGATPFVSSEPQSPTDRKPSYAVIVDAAFTCDLTKLDTSEAWQNVGPNAKSFVRGLLVLDETSRLTTDEALNHVWYSYLEEDFEKLYNFTIRHWNPRKPAINIIERLEKSARKDAYEVARTKTPRVKDYKPIETHYKPAHKNIDKLLLPARFRSALSPVKEIREKPMEVADPMENPPMFGLRTSGQTLPWRDSDGKTSSQGKDKLVKPGILTKTSPKGSSGLQTEGTCSTMNMDEVPDTAQKPQRECPFSSQNPSAVSKKRKLGCNYLFGEDYDIEERLPDMTIQSGKKKKSRLCHKAQVHPLFESNASPTDTPFRSLRQREPIQLHPYAIEAESYRRTLGSQTTTYLSADQSELYKRIPEGPGNSPQSCQVETETNSIDEIELRQQMREEETCSQVFTNSAELEYSGPHAVQAERSGAGDDNEGTFFTPINRRQSIRLGDGRHGMLKRKFSAIANEDDGPLSSKMAGISITSSIKGSRPVSYGDSRTPSKENSPSQAASDGSNNLLMEDTPETPALRRQSSIFDNDEDELYAETSIAKPNFRSALSFGRSVERRRKEKRAADLSDSIRTACL